MQESGEEDQSPRDLGLRIIKLIIAPGGPREDEVMGLIDLGADLEVWQDVQFARGKTPLVYAAYCASPELVRLLIEKGADLRARCGAGATPLHWAARWGRAASVRVLIEAGSDPNEVDFHGKSVLTKAVREKDSSYLFNSAVFAGSRLSNEDPLETCKVLIEAGADPLPAFDSIEGMKEFFDGDIGWVPEEAMQRMKKRERARGAFGRF